MGNCGYGAGHSGQVRYSRGGWDGDLVYGAHERTSVKGRGSGEHEKLDQWVQVTSGDYRVLFRSENAEIKF